VVSRAAEAGVTRIITIGTSVEGSRRAVAIAERYPNIYAVVGIHPTSADEAEENAIDQLREIAQHPRVVALGEMGLDYHRLPSTRVQPNKIAALGNETPADIEGAVEDGAYKQQQAVFFQAQLDLAVELGLNVVIHQRDSWDDTLNILRPYSGKLRAVYHCFGGTPHQARELLELGHLVSFTGIITFKNAATVQETVSVIPDDSFMVETDCPYLAPVPHRGKRCEPAFTRFTAEKAAELRGQTLEHIAAVTTKTAESFFRLPN
jgi:TatD DNase family protein